MMKKFLVLGMGLCLCFGMYSCKSSESAYRKAYEKAKAEEQTATTTQEPATVSPVVTPVVTPVQTAPTNSNVNYRSERVSVVGDGTLEDYSVVVGSFGVEANARSLQQRLAGRGYNSLVVSATTSKGLMYRVVAASYSDKNQAANLRDKLQGEFPGAWMLYRSR